jgi:hypothetical protein
MLRRFAPHIVIACLVLAFLGVGVWKIIWEIMPESYVDPRAARSCAELFSLYSAPYQPTLSPALSTTMQMCDRSVQFYNAEEALIRRLEAPDNPCERMRDALDRIKGSHGLTLLDRVGSCHVAADDPGFKGLMSVKLADKASFDRPQTPVSDVQLCEEVHASLMQDAPSDRAFQAFKAHTTKKNHCDFLLEVSNTEQAIISRLERASVNCGHLAWLKTQHVETLEIQTKVCDAAAIDPDGLVRSYTR